MTCSCTNAFILKILKLPNLIDVIVPLIPTVTRTNSVRKANVFLKKRQTRLVTLGAVNARTASFVEEPSASSNVLLTVTVLLVTIAPRILFLNGVSVK